MHEASIAKLVLDTVTGLVASGEIAGRVVAVRLRVGKLAAVVPENLVFLFGALSEHTALVGARLEIEHVPVRLACEACHAVTEIEEADFRCERCLSRDVRLQSGRELLIESVEVADPEPHLAVQ